MLACAEECGGQRYVASAIVACSQKENYEDVVKTLAALGTTWLTHLLFPCQFYDIAVNRKNLIFSLVRSSRSHETQSDSDQESSELTTPTLHRIWEKW